ncbi:MAG: agmatinase [Deltaproteobacteria bacterium]|nr:agmatinase [Deltaproteobacteria bacterium]
MNEEWKVQFPVNFGYLPLESCRYDGSRVAILPVPYDSTASFRTGAREGPQAILRASESIEVFDHETGTDLVKVGVATLPPPILDRGNPEHMVDEVAAKVRRISGDGKFPVLLGGEHTVTLGAIRALATDETPFTILQVDAHLGLRDSFDGTRHCHACVMRRIIESFPSCRLVQVATRSVSAQEAAYLEETDIHPFYMERVRALGPGFIDKVMQDLGESVYLTLDLDGLDPAWMPAVGNPEPGGLGYYELMGLLRSLCSHKRVLGADIVGLNPIPGEFRSEAAVAKILLKLIAWLFRE